MRVLVLLVVLASLAGAQPGEGGSYSLEQPLAAQRELSPGLVGDLTPPTGAALGLPRGVGPVRVEAGASGVPGAVRLDAPGVRVEGRAAAVLGRLAAGETGASVLASLAVLPTDTLFSQLATLRWYDNADSDYAMWIVYSLANRSDYRVCSADAVPASIRWAFGRYYARLNDDRCSEFYLSSSRPAGDWPFALVELAHYLQRSGRGPAAVPIWGLAASEAGNDDWRTEFQRNAEVLGALAAKDRDGAASILDRVVNDRGVDLWIRLVSAVDLLSMLTMSEQYDKTIEHVAAYSGLLDHHPAARPLLLSSLVEAHLAMGDEEAAADAARRIAASMAAYEPAEPYIAQVLSRTTERPLAWLRARDYWAVRPIVISGLPVYLSKSGIGSLHVRTMVSARLAVRSLHPGLKVLEPRLLGVQSAKVLPLGSAAAEWLVEVRAVEGAEISAAMALELAVAGHPYQAIRVGVMRADDEPLPLPADLAAVFIGDVVAGETVHVTVTLPPDASSPTVAMADDLLVVARCDASETAQPAMVFTCAPMVGTAEGVVGVPYIISYSTPDGPVRGRGRCWVRVRDPGEGLEYQGGVQ
ncbi:MAG TPA: hypothetical protein DCZ72_04990 [Armatimonadetes bacterium]|nr:hypothetical protein [Armatimonadota bacterium]